MSLAYSISSARMVNYFFIAILKHDIIDYQMEKVSSLEFPCEIFEGIKRTELNWLHFFFFFFFFSQGGHKLQTKEKINDKLAEIFAKIGSKENTRAVRVTVTTFKKNRYENEDNVHDVTWA